MVRNPGGGYGWTINEIGQAISRYAQIRSQNQKPWGITKTAKQVAQYFFSATQRQLQTIFRLGEQAFQAGKSLTRQRQGINIARESIPVDTSLPKGTAYRAKVLVKTTDSMTGLESFRTLTMDFDRNPMLRDIVLKITLEQKTYLAISPRRDAQGNIVTETQERMGFESVISIVRRTY